MEVAITEVKVTHNEYLYTAHYYEGSSLGWELTRRPIDKLPHPNTTERWCEKGWTTEARGSRIGGETVYIPLYNQMLEFISEH